LGNGLLDDSVYHRWDTQLAHTSIWFGDFLSPHGRWGVFPFPNALKQFRSVFLQPRQGLLYGHPVGARCSVIALDLLVGSVQVVSVQNPLQQVLCTVSFFPFPRAGTRHFCILFTFHAIPLHEALSVFCCHGTSPPSGLYSRLTIVRPFPFFSGTMASADFLRQALLRRFGFFFPYFCVRKTSPGKSNNLPPIYLPHLQCKVRAVLDFVLYGRLVRFALPHMRFLFVRPGVCPCRHFAASTSSFLQIPPHDGHPCLRLTVPPAKS